MSDNLKSNGENIEMQNAIKLMREDESILGQYYYFVSDIEM